MRVPRDEVVGKLLTIVARYDDEEVMAVEDGASLPVFLESGTVHAHILFMMAWEGLLMLYR